MQNLLISWGCDGEIPGAFLQEIFQSCRKKEKFFVFCLNLQELYIRHHINLKYSLNLLLLLYFQCGTFSLVSTETPKWELSHACNTSYTKSIVIIDDKGMSLHIAYVLALSTKFESHQVCVSVSWRKTLCFHCVVTG